MSPGDWKGSEEAVSASRVNSRCLDPSMKDFFTVFLNSQRGVKVKPAFKQAWSKGYPVGNSERNLKMYLPVTTPVPIFLR